MRDEYSLLYEYRDKLNKEMNDFFEKHELNPRITDRDCINKTISVIRKLNDEFNSNILENGIPVQKDYFKKVLKDYFIQDPYSDYMVEALNSL